MVRVGREGFYPGLLAELEEDRAKAMLTIT